MRRADPLPARRQVAQGFPHNDRGGMWGNGKQGRHRGLTLGYYIWIEQMCKYTLTNLNEQRDASTLAHLRFDYQSTLRFPVPPVQHLLWPDL
jgi:hypothetical protein